MTSVDLPLQVGIGPSFRLQAKHHAHPPSAMVQRELFSPNLDSKDNCEQQQQTQSNVPNVLHTCIF